ncbi:MAG TPA: peptidase M28 [Cyanobacteria bacterium UBA11049]|nr:peptidase M28 [Cyanobacteria bacterium UBA11049]
MKKWIGLALLVLVMVGVVNSSKFLPHQSSRRFQQQITVVQQSKASTANAASMYVNTLKVSREKLLAHIRALNYRRYTEAERDRTRAYLIQSLKQLGWKTELQTFENGVNIFAQRQGTDPKAGSILVGAHYDTVSVSPGADDNATGVAVVLEVARLLGSRPTARTLQLALFDREELGLLGSRAFVANEKHLENLQGAIVMDMVGFACHKVGCQKYPQGLPVVPPSDRGDFLAVVGDMEHATLLDAFQPSGQDSLPPVLTLPVPLKGMLMPDTLRSDHAPFWYRGVGAVLLTDTANLRTPHYHQPSDTPATLDKSFFTASAQLVVNATTKLLEARSPQLRG